MRWSKRWLTVQSRDIRQYSSPPTLPSHSQQYSQKERKKVIHHPLPPAPFPLAMPSSTSNSSSSAPRRRSSRATSARRASAATVAADPKASASQTSSLFDDFPSYAPPASYFLSSTPLQIKRTVNITVEISSKTTTASHMDVSQYHMPVTTSCYSPSSGDGLYEYSTISEYETATEYGAFSSSTATTSSYSHDQSTQSSTDESEFPFEQLSSYSKYKPQHESKTLPSAAPKHAYQTSSRRQR